METSTIRLAMYMVVAIVVVGIAYFMYDTVTKQQEPYQLATEFKGFSTYYSSAAESQESQDYLLDEIYTGEACTEEGGLDKCFEELGNIMEGQGLFTSQELLSRARRVKYCRSVVDDMVEKCITDFNENACYDVRDIFISECYYL